MNNRCRKCNWSIIKLQLSNEQRQKITYLLNQNKKMAAIKYVKEHSRISLDNAKRVVLHLNKTFGNCIRCNYSELTEENTNCPKCNAFNYNWNTKKTHSNALE